jgi:branched-chain amino acid transport system permease protein
VIAEFLQLTLNGLTVGSFYALVALGYTVVYGIVKLINFAHGDLTALCSFVGLTFLAVVAPYRWPVWVDLLGAFLVPMLLAPLLMYGIFRTTYRPMLKRGAMLGLMIVALGAALVLQNTMLLVFGATPRPYPPLIGFGGFSMAGIHVTYVQIVLLLLAAALMAGMYAFVQKTVLGAAMRALAVDHEAARVMGINVDALVAAAFMVGAVFAAASGVMIGLYYTQITFTIGFFLGLRAFTAAVIGGIGNIPGAMLGGLIIGLLEAYSGGFISGRWQDVMVFGVLIATLVARPTGIFGERVAERV